VHERLLHFVDLELLQADPARRRYAQDLSNKPALADMPRDMKDERWRAAGMLPWRVADCRRRLVQCIRAGRLVDRPGQFPRDEHATRWAGYLAHYIQDSTQPHHATIDYKSLSYLPADAKQTNVHNDMEFRLVDDNLADYPELRKAFWTIFVRKLDEVDDPAAGADPWEAAMRTLLISYDALPLIGRAAKDAYLDAQGNVRPFNAEAFFSAKGVYRGREMTLMELKAQQLAWAVVRLQALWLSAWNEATATPTSPVEPPAAATTSAPPAESKADPRP
jgi:hypothetical protein